MNVLHVLALFLFATSYGLAAAWTAQEIEAVTRPQPWRLHVAAALWPLVWIVHGLVALVELARVRAQGRALDGHEQAARWAAEIDGMTRAQLLALDRVTSLPERGTPLRSGTGRAGRPSSRWAGLGTAFAYLATSVVRVLVWSILAGLVLWQLAAWATS